MGQEGSETTFTIIKDTVEHENLHYNSQQFYLAEMPQGKPREPKFYDSFGAATPYSIKYANMVYAYDLETSVKGFDFEYKSRNGFVDTYHSENSWLTREMRKALNSTQPGDSVIIKNIKYENYWEQIITAEQLEFVIVDEIKNDNRLFTGTLILGTNKKPWKQ